MKVEMLLCQEHALRTPIGMKLTFDMGLALVRSVWSWKNVSTMGEEKSIQRRTSIGVSVWHNTFVFPKGTGDLTATEGVDGHRPTEERNSTVLPILVEMHGV